MAPHDADSVYIPRAEYLRLLQVSHQYDSLRESLIRGGITNETIALLSSNPEFPPGDHVDPDTPLDQTLKDKTASVAHQGAHRRQSTGTETLYDDESLDQDSPLVSNPSDSVKSGNELELSRQVQRVATRTILISNLPEGTSHADITAVVRGGQMLDIFLRHRDMSASVSFLNEHDARAFYDYARKHDLYIKQRRLGISWSDRQYTLLDHLARKIEFGATRNLVIRRCSPQHTESSVRDDLEHIHNLIVVAVEFYRRDCYIRTNSVVGAPFAKTCMMSRQKYKGSRVDFAEDECAQPLEWLVLPTTTRTTSAPQTVTPSTITMTNRFHLLDLDYD